MRSCDGPVRCPVTGAWECPYTEAQPEPGESWEDMCSKCKASYGAWVDRQIDAKREVA